MAQEGHGVQCVGSGTHTRMSEKNVLKMTDLREVIGWLRVVKKPQEERGRPWGSKAQVGAPKLGCGAILQHEKVEGAAFVNNLWAGGGHEADRVKGRGFQGHCLSLLM